MAICLSFDIFATESSGVEFYDREIGLSQEVLKSFSEQLVNTEYNKKTDINELRFSHSLKKSHQKNLSLSSEVKRPIFMVIGQRLGLTIYKKLDPDLDGFFEETFQKVEGRPYLYEELFTFGEGNFHRMRKRYFPNPGSALLKVEVAFREHENQPFKKTGTYTFSTLEAMTNGNGGTAACMGPSLLILRHGLADSVSDIIDRFQIDNLSSKRGRVKFEASFDSDCGQKVSSYLNDPSKSIENVYQEALGEGLSCLQHLSKPNNADNNSFSRILYLNAVAGLSGQAIFMAPAGKTGEDSLNPSNPSFPRRAERRPFLKQQILCSQRPNDFKDDEGRSKPNALGMASVLPSETTILKCEKGREMEIGYPFISLNFQALNKSSDQARLNKDERLLKIKKLIFHEFLHTTGVPHEDGYDPVNACAEFCFNRGRLSPSAERAALKVCMGKGMGTFSGQSIQRRAEAQFEYNSFFKY